MYSYAHLDATLNVQALAWQEEKPVKKQTTSIPIFTRITKRCLWYLQGCDSYASWDPRFRHLSPVLDTDAIAHAIVDTLPHKEWRDEHLVITGGEPLMSGDTWKLLDWITFETNGTQKLSEEFKEYLLAWDRCDHWRREITFSVSAKLPCSGESWSDAICPEVVREYEQYGTAYLKFVISTEEDLIDAERAVEEFRAGGFTGPVYIMPVGGVERVYSLNNRSVAEMAMRKGWRYSDRLQVPLFKNEWGT